MKTLVIYVLLALGLAVAKPSPQRLAVCPEGPYGGSGGDQFTDATFEANGPITSVRIRHGDRIDSIQFRYGNTWAPVHGSDGGELAEFDLVVDEFITQIDLRAADRIDQLTFITTSRIYGPYGGSGGIHQSASGEYLRYISGRSNRELDQLTFYFNC